MKLKLMLGMMLAGMTTNLMAFDIIRVGNEFKFVKYRYVGHVLVQNRAVLDDTEKVELQTIKDTDFSPVEYPSQDQIDLAAAILIAEPNLTVEDLNKILTDKTTLGIYLIKYSNISAQYDQVDSKSGISFPTEASMAAGLIDDIKKVYVTLP